VNFEAKDYIENCQATAEDIRERENRVDYIENVDGEEMHRVGVKIKTFFPSIFLKIKAKIWCKRTFHSKHHVFFLLTLFLVD
jgi:hypothetical protein